MDDRRVGQLVRRARIGRRWRQIDLERASGVDQTPISLVERGRLGTFTLDTLRRVSEALDIPLELWPRVPSARVSRLLDEGHAAIGEQLMTLLGANRWITIPEYTFSHYGGRGSVDVVGWHAASRTVAIIEVKTQLMDVQEILSSLDRKSRVVPRLLAAERGWQPSAAGHVLVVEDRTAARRVVAQHRTTFDTAFPARSWEVRAWLRRNGTRGSRRPGAVERVRLRAPRSARV